MPKVQVKSIQNGPNVLLVDEKPVTYICRCGASAKKPYCDGSHKKIGFSADAAEVKILE